MPTEYAVITLISLIALGWPKATRTILDLHAKEGHRGRPPWWARPFVMSRAHDISCGPSKPRRETSAGEGQFGQGVDGFTPWVWESRLSFRTETALRLAGSAAVGAVAVVSLVACAAPDPPTPTATPAMPPACTTPFECRIALDREDGYSEELIQAATEAGLLACGILRQGASLADLEQSIASSFPLHQQVFVAEYVGHSLVEFCPDQWERVFAASAAAEPTPTRGRALLPTPIATPAPDSSCSLFICYEVQVGETLFEIAERYDVSVADIIEVNQLSPDGFIRAGTTILVPGGRTVATPTPTATATASPEPSTGYACQIGADAQPLRGRAPTRQLIKLEEGDYCIKTTAECSVLIAAAHTPETTAEAYAPRIDWLGGGVFWDAGSVGLVRRPSGGVLRVGSDPTDDIRAGHAVLVVNDCEAYEMSTSQLAATPTATP